jgi:hypothetical protein
MPSTLTDAAPRATSASGLRRSVTWATCRPGPGRERHLERGEGAVVGAGVTGAVGGTLEEQQQAVALVDLLAAPLDEQVARDPIVRRPQRRHPLVAERRRQPGAVDDVGQEQGAKHRHPPSLPKASRRECAPAAARRTSLSPGCPRGAPPARTIVRP